MKQDDLLKQLLSLRPSETQIAEAAARARRRALGRLGERHSALSRVRRWPVLATTAALAACSVLLFWHAGELSVPPSPTSVSLEVRQEPPVKMILILADGTRVIWTIDAGYSL